MRILKVLCLALALMLCGAALAEGAPALAEVGAEVDFTLTTLNGEEFRLSENRGKVVYLNIWATWCPPCVAEIPDIQKLADAHPDELIVVGASVDETSDVVADFIEEKGLTYLIGMDEDYRLAALLFPTQGIPESVFIDPNGVVSSIDIGMMEYDEMEERFQTALGGIE